MSPKEARNWSERSADIQAAARRVAELVEGRSYETFIEDQNAVDAVLYNLIVIGEAAGFAPPEIVAARPDIPWGKIKGMRNAVSHGYFAVDLEVVWSTATVSVPEFSAALGDKPTSPPAC